MTYAELTVEVEKLRRLVDSLCVAVIAPKQDDEEERQRLLLRCPAGVRGYRLLTEAMAQRRFDELEYQRKTMLEDYPSIKVEK